MSIVPTSAEDELLHRLGLRREAIPGLKVVHFIWPYIYIDLSMDVHTHPMYSTFMERIDCHPEYLTMFCDGTDSKHPSLTFLYPNVPIQEDWYEVLDPSCPFRLVLPVRKECTLAQDEVLAICQKVDWEDEMADGSYWMYDPKFRIRTGYDDGDLVSPDLAFVRLTKLGEHSMYIEITGECVTDDQNCPPLFEELFEDDMTSFQLRLADPSLGGDPRLLLDTEKAFALVSNPNRTVTVAIEM